MLLSLFYRFVRQGRVTWPSYPSGSSVPNTLYILYTFGMLETLFVRYFYIFESMFVVPPPEWYDHIIFACVSNLPGDRSCMAIRTDFWLEWMWIVFLSLHWYFAIDCGYFKHASSSFVRYLDGVCRSWLRTKILEPQSSKTSILYRLSNMTSKALPSGRLLCCGLDLCFDRSRPGPPVSCTFFMGVTVGVRYRSSTVLALQASSD